MEHSKELEELIKVALEDSKLNAQEMETLKKRAKSEGISPDEFEIYINSRLNRKKKENSIRLFLGAVIFWCLMVGLGFYLEKGDIEEANENYGWSYEKACENGDFMVAHNLLEKLQKEVLEEKKLEVNHQIKKEKKTHWFKDDEYVVDSISVDDHNQFMRDLQDKGRKYLTGLDYVYNAEIAYVKEMNEDDCSEKVNHLLSELKSKLLLFKSLNMEDEAQDVYDKIQQKVNGQSIEETDYFNEEKTETLERE